MYQEKINTHDTALAQAQIYSKKNAVNRLQYQSFALLTLCESEHTSSHHDRQQQSTLFVMSFQKYWYK